ncbi:hypothetical protein vseg_005661 [Gypsophila vaccaria]
MEVVVLPPQDALKRHHPHHHHRRRNPNTQPARSHRRRRNSTSPPPAPAPAAAPTLSSPLRILKRGEDLPQPARPAGPKREPVAAGSIGPMFVNGFYAGSACVTSPAPSELPVPAFFSRVVAVDGKNERIADDLRRVLKLF